MLGDTTSTTSADGTHQATATYNNLKEQTAFTDPDLGSYALTYDNNGNLLSSVDPRGASGTMYLGYDGLNRNIWKSTHSDGSSPLATATYDSTASGNQGVGRLTGETFASGPSQSVTGSYAYTYDVRGQQTKWTMTLGTTSYPFTTGYNDAGQATSLTYPDGDVVTTSYGAQDWLSGVTEAKGGTTNTLLNSLSYTGANGASQMPTSAAVDNGVYTWNLSYDPALRLSETKATQVSTSTVCFDQTRTFDAVGNVTTTNTTVAAGTDHQAFCYDEQNRLVWAGSQGTPSCGVALTPGTLNSGNARYTQSYAYDVLNRLTTGPKGSGYTYGDATHLDAVTSATGYTASYDAAGSMTGHNGNVLGYDALRRLITWQNTATNPTQTASYAYDGGGNRVQQAVTSGGTTTTTSYIGSYEEVSVTGSTTTTTKYYRAGVTNVVNVTGTLTYLVADTLGSVSVGLTAAGGVQATSLYAPYGSVRYSSGTLPTSYGYTQMRQDPSGLNYDHARYYDASVGQFISADSVQGPNRYGYVAGNPETSTDPTGQRVYTPCDGESAADCAPYQRPTPPPTTSPPIPTGDGTSSGGNGGSGNSGGGDSGGGDSGASGSGSSGGGKPPCPDCSRANRALTSASSIFGNFIFALIAVGTGITELWDLLKGGANSMKKLADIAGIFANFSTALNYFANIASVFFSKGGPLGGILEAVDVLSTISNTIAGWLRWSTQLYKSAGIFAQFVGDAVSVALSGLVNVTPIGMAENLFSTATSGVVYQLTGEDFGDIIEHGGQAAWSIGQLWLQHQADNLDESSAKGVCNNFLFRSLC